MSRKQAVVAFLLSSLLCMTFALSLAFAEGPVTLGRAPTVSAPFGQMVIEAQPPVTITHSVSQSIEPGTVACGNAGAGYTVENSYYRVFDLDAAPFNLTGPLMVQSVEFAVEEATGGADATQDVTVRLHSLNGALNTANLTLLASATVAVPDQALSLISVPLTVTVPHTTTLVYEVFSPNGQATLDQLYLGSNAAGQTGPSYIRAPGCGIAQPTDFAAINFPNIHLVMNVRGMTGGATAVTLSDLSTTETGTLPLAALLGLAGLALGGTFVWHRSRR